MGFQDGIARSRVSRTRNQFGFAKPTATGSGGGLTEASFAASFSDAGGGVVTTTLRKGTGSATFTRATTAAARTGVLAAGVGYIWNLGVASGSPRSHYDPNGIYLGYLSEGAATQLITNTRDLSQVAWVKVNMTAALTSTGLENVGSSCSRVTCVVGGDTILQTIVAAASQRTFSAYVKRVTGVGTVTMNAGSTSLDITALINTSTFTLVQVTDNSLNAAVGFTITTAADAIDVDCVQFEAGAFATTPIPAAGTRNADSLTYVFAGNVNVSVGTCSAKAYSLTSSNTGSSQVIVGFDPTSNFPLYRDSSGAATTINILDGTNVLQKTGVADFSLAPQTRVSAWGGPTQAVTSSGLPVSSGPFDGSIGSTAISVGCDTSAGRSLYGCVQSLSIWTQKFSNADLQTLSQT